ncbi:MAG: DinB family protein [Actinomycetota bacterium]|nr:DinB family protein [Actinomycetota bacterium]
MTRDRKPPRTENDEKAVLLGFLDHLREAVATKAAGVPEPDVRAAGVPSGTSLLGLVTHLTAVERFSFTGEEPPSWPATFRAPDALSADAAIAAYRDAVAEANAVIGACTDLAAPAPRWPRRGGAPAMRWVLAHLIEETGRHAGHMDILRERIDGSTGR